MTKAEIVTSISEKIGVEKVDVQAVVEAFMKEVKDSLSKDENVYLRGFEEQGLERHACLPIE